MTWFEQLPKIELHIHLEGAIPHVALWELIQKYGGDPSVPDLRTLEKRFEYRDFSHFIETWSWKNQFLREYEDFTYIAEQTAHDLVSQNVRYAEMFFSPSIFARHGLRVQNLTEAIRAGLSRVPAIEVALVADLVRDYGPKLEINTLEKVKEVKRQGIVGIGIGGSEHEFPPEPFQPLYELARQMGFRTNAHAGEAAGPRSIWSAIRYLHVDRIGHGTRANEDKALINYLIEERIPIEMCPISNVRTGVVDSLEAHPIRECFQRGMIISINTDDPKMFGTSLAEEYRLLAQQCGFSREEVCRLILLGIESSWLTKNRKQALSEDFTSHESWEHTVA